MRAHNLMCTERSMIDHHPVKTKKSGMKLALEGLHILALSQNDTPLTRNNANYEKPDTIRSRQ